MTALGACLRLYHLTAQSLWHDEAGSLVVASMSLARVLDHFRPSSVEPFELNPPLYFYLLHGWMALFGFGELQARLLSALAGVASIPLVFLLARQLFDERTGRYAALLLAVSQLGVMYSQETRAYEVLLPLFLATAYFYVVAEQRRSTAAWWWCTAFALSMVATHYYGVLAVAALAVYTALVFRSIPRAWVAASAALGAAVFLPWYRFALSAQLHRASTGTQPSYYAVTQWTIVSALNRFGNGAVNGLLRPAPHWAFVTGAILFGGPILFVLTRAWTTSSAADRALRRPTLFVLVLTLVPVLLAYALGALVNLQYDVRYIAFAVAPFYMLTAAGLSKLPSISLRFAAATAVVCYSLYALQANYFMPYKENYRDAIRAVVEQAEPADCYAFVPFGVVPLEWSIYVSQPPPTVLALRDAPASASRCQRVWVFTYSRVMTEEHERWAEWLSAATVGASKGFERQFFWMKVERYDRRT